MSSCLASAFAAGLVASLTRTLPPKTPCWSPFKDSPRSSSRSLIVARRPTKRRDSTLLGASELYTRPSGCTSCKSASWSNGIVRDPATERNSSFRFSFSSSSSRRAGSGRGALVGSIVVGNAMAHTAERSIASASTIDRILDNVRFI